MDDSRDLKPTTPEFQVELVLLLAQICRHLLEKHRQERNESIALAPHIAQETVGEATLSDRF
jgi:hypothetical protein